MIIAAAGNNYENLAVKESYPAVYSKQYPGFITVGWGTQDGNLEKGNQSTWGSNYSPDHVKILAPGTSIASTLVPTTVAGYTSLGDGIGQGSGSSFATPMVSAAAALAIGFMKAHNLTFDERLIEYLLTEKGSHINPNLTSYVHNGSVLDLNKLGNSLKYLVDSGTSPQPIKVTNPSIHYDAPTQSAVATFGAEWNLDLTHYGARLGLFDASCGYSSPCLIQDYVLDGNIGSRTFNLTRNETLPILADPSDPDFKLPISVAIYYTILDPKTKK